MERDILHKRRWVFRSTTMFCCLMCLLPHKVYARTEATIYPDHFSLDIDDQLRQQEEIDDVAGNATLIDNKEWSNQRAISVKDMTDYVPGVIAQAHDGDESFRLSIRGSGLANTFQGEGLLVLQDGIPINMADGEFEFPVIDPYLIRYAEIFPGADALQFGSSNLGWCH